MSKFLIYIQGKGHSLHFIMSLEHGTKGQIFFDNKSTDDYGDGDTVGIQNYDANCVH